MRYTNYSLVKSSIVESTEKYVVFRETYRKDPHGPFLFSDIGPLRMPDEIEADRKERLGDLIELLPRP